MAFPSSKSKKPKTPKRQLETTVIHFDYDCFYASVFENENPSLKTLPLAVQQKQIVVTCNYEARRRGLYKLQLISEAKRLCPDVVIVLGEDLNRFRNASKELYAFLRSFSWNVRCERLGFDEVFMDVSDIIEYNASILNANNLRHSFFCLSKHDPTVGFPFDATIVAGHTYPETSNDTLVQANQQQYMRGRLESEKGYTATVGISTNKVLAKLVGNLHKPNGQTTLLPPYNRAEDEVADNVTLFMDEHEVGKIPGIGFKMAQKIRTHVLQRPANFDNGLVYGGTKENVLVRDVRQYLGMGPETLERLLGGSGVPAGIGTRIWDLMNGCDAIEVGQAREVPTQISIEDSYIRLDTLDEVTKELRMLAISLLKRMHADLLEEEEEEQMPIDSSVVQHAPTKRWLAHPKTIRISTRPRPPQNPDGSRNRSFARISKSTSMPGFVFSLKEDISTLVERLIVQTLLPLFRQLHPEKSGWNLSLVNIAAANMADAASEKGGVGRDIAKMFRRQDDVLKQRRVADEVDESVMSDKKVDPPPAAQLILPPYLSDREGSEDKPTPSQEGSRPIVDHWDSEDEEMLDADAYRCEECGAFMPLFAMGAHERWHAQC
ncbi:DNA/RNA polymerase [Setomelanomma holmii]|uniref:DNA/RNA polymerase n=1 Tax=Setomelanomma holmii TaxID=210430 RepID=A0A9P4HJ54_9PLEO|nr:DNA/RNA polymerase [Setomelanomma holmii]